MDDSHVTHGILFPGVNVFKDEAHEVSIFKEKIAVRADPESRATAEEKDRLGAVFKEIWQELYAGKDGSGGEQSEARFEAGSLKQLLTNPIMRRRLTGIVVRHKSEWSVGQAGKFEELKALIRKHKCAEEAERLGKRIADLGIRLKGEGFDSEREVYYFHPLGMIGWLVNKRTYVTLEQLNILFPSADVDKKQGIADIYNEYCESFNMHTPRVIAHFFAQIMEEVGPNISYKNENLNYSSEHLKRPNTIIVNGKKLKKGPFSYFIRNPSEADKYGRNSNHPADQKMIANLAYSNRNGNGNVS
ncbi:type IV secretion protein Rhs [Aggregatibacter actinomycetemcomitans]|uniref:type IV secretion protein Rhs n=1 Tax=Aggregatibacter actinomycetemcomitans TaxID=714 RepID=UPI000AA57692|nr:type IV secretion protein Rhs [Aggregatibacter actinomycetemcomitans]